MLASPSQAVDKLAAAFAPIPETFNTQHFAVRKCVISKNISHRFNADCVRNKSNII